MRESLEILANVASVFTALVAVLAACYYALDRRRKREKLENYLRDAKRENPNRHTYTILHLMAQLGLTESEILNASFSSRRVSRKEHVNRDTMLTDQILFEHRE